jgi:DNA-binding NarL/FixJ family response regulator
MTGNPIRALLADDHELVLEGLRNLIDSEPDIHVVKTAATGLELLYLLGEYDDIDVVVTDLEMPPDDLNVLAEIRRRGFDVRVLVLTAYSDIDSIRQAVELEAEGYAIKTESPRQTIEAIRQVAQGRLVYPRSAQRWLMGREEPPPTNIELSPRETDVIELVAEGLTNAQIADRLHISENTVRFHLKNIFEKIQVTNRTEAAAWYLTGR